MEVRIETIGPIQVARIRHTGSCAELGPRFERLFRWAAAIGVPTGRVLTLSRHDSETPPAGRLRSDACVELRTGEEPPPGIELDSVGGGRYAVYRLEGPREGIAPAYARLLGEWLPGSGESVGAGPCLALYRSEPGAGPAAKAVTDLCVPLRGKTAG